jgi:hypothetical protein
MSKPTEAELKAALAEAARMREQGDDPHHIAKALLNCHYMQRELEQVLRAAEEYLRSGLAEPEHLRLERAIEKARRAGDRGAHVERPVLGL